MRVAKWTIKTSLYMKMKILLIPALIASLVACENPAKSKPAAEVSPVSEATQSLPSDAPPAPIGQPPAVKGESVPLTPENTKVGFIGSKVTGSHTGGFNQVSGRIDLGATPQSSNVDIEIDTTTVFTNSDGLTKHLKSAEFFDTTKYPRARFASTQIEPGKTPGEYEMSGTLNLRGVEKTIRFPANIQVTPASVSVRSEFSINRRDFNINYAGAPNDLIRDEVVIKISILATRKPKKS